MTGTPLSPESLRAFAPLSPEDIDRNAKLWGEVKRAPRNLREVIPSGKGRVTTNEYLARVRRGQTCGLPSMAHLAGTESGTVCIVGGGPTLTDTVGELRHLMKRGAKIIAVNKSHDWLLKRGFRCDYSVLLDPKPWVVDYINLDLAKSREIRKRAGKYWVETKHLIASQCDDSVINKFQGRKDAFIWHAGAGVGEMELLKSEFPAPHVWCNLAGASVVGLRAVNIAHALGFSVMHTFGLDGSMKPGNQLYAYDKPHIEKTWKAFTLKLSSGWKRDFASNHHMARAVYEFEDCMKEWDGQIKSGRMRPFQVKVHGDPEVSAIALIAAGMGVHAEPSENEKYGKAP
jgi:hypothetical protein